MKQPGDPELGRFAGGKALLRLLQDLESRGLGELAETARNAAVSDEGRAVLAQHAARFCALPLRDEPAAAFAEAPSPAGVTTGDALAAEYLRVGHMLGPPAAGSPQWRSLGPWTIANGQSAGMSVSRVNVAGRISAIAIDPNDPAHVLCGAGNGGVWESRDRGASWNPRTDFAPTTAVGAVVFDLHDSAIAYCGTGEGAWTSLGAGILRSADGGTTWQTLCEMPFVGQGFFDIRIDPGETARLLAATTGGLYLSTDGGTTWSQRRGAMTWSIAIAPAGGPGAEIFAAGRDGLFRSTDGGATWDPVALPAAPAAFNRLAVGIAPSNPDVAYAWGANDSRAFLWRRANGTWSVAETPADVNVSQAWYDWYVAVSPDDDAQVYCGANDLHRGGLTGTAWTWTTISSKGATGNSIHPDQHAIAFEPGQPGTIYAGCDGGLFRSTDRGDTWQSLNHGLVIGEFAYLAQHPGSSRALLGGLQDNGTVRWTGAASWEHVADGDGGHCGYNPRNPATMFRTIYAMNPFRSATGGDFAAWAQLALPVPDGEQGLFYPPLRASATTGDTVAIGGGALYVSRDNGSSWVRLAFPGTVTKASALAVPGADAVYAGTTDGRLFRTAWSGTAWADLDALATPRANALVSMLFVDPANADRMWATYSTLPGSCVFRSDDGGTSWADCGAGLPQLPVNAVAVDSRDARRVWVAADRGVYQSLDAGASWNAFSNGLPNALVGEIVFHPHAWMLRAATKSRGVWEIAVDGPMAAPDCGVQFTAALGPGRTQQYDQDLPATWNVVWTVMPTSFAPSAQASYAISVQRRSNDLATHRLTVTNLTTVPLTFEVRYAVSSRG